MTRGRQVIYGYYEPHDSLAVADEREIIAISREVELLQAVRKIAELKIVRAQLVEAAFLVDDESLEGRADDEPWEWSELGPVADGDWPPMPTGAVLDLYRDDETLWSDLQQSVGIQIKGTTMSGSFGWIDPAEQPELMAFFVRHGIDGTRDDGLILGGSMYA